MAEAVTRSKNMGKEAEWVAEQIVDRVLIGVTQRIRQHYVAVIRNYLNDCVDGTWGRSSWRTKQWIGTHSREDLFVDWTKQFMAIQPMAYPYPEHLEQPLVAAVMEAGYRVREKRELSQDWEIYPVEGGRGVALWRK